MTTGTTRSFAGRYKSNFNPLRYSKSLRTEIAEGSGFG